MERRWVREAMTSTDMEQAKANLEKLTAWQFQRALNDAYRIIYRERILDGLYLQDGRSPDDREASTDLPLLGTALAAMSIGIQRGVEVTRSFKRKVQREFIAETVETVLENRGKIAPIDRAAKKY